MKLIADTRRLVKLNTEGSYLITVYINTRWADEKQRERVKIFFRNELKKMVENMEKADHTLEDDLDKIQTHIKGLIKQEYDEMYNGIALFLSSPLGVSMTIRSRAPFENQFAVAQEPKVRQLARLMDEYAHALLVMIDTDSARIFDISLGGFTNEEDIQHDVHGRHAQGGWSQMRYQRHRQAQQDRHQRDVAEYLTKVFDAEHPDHLILSGQEPTVASFQDFLPVRLQSRIIDIVKLDMKEGRDKIIETAINCLQKHERADEDESVDKLIETAEAGGAAVITADEVAQMVIAGKASRLMIHRKFSEQGWRCRSCGAIGHKIPLGCTICGATVEASDLGEDLVREVIRRDGEVESVAENNKLANKGGVGAFLRYR
ncbi:Vms1/Ankzf1 family peptidyl-tRNA hydrolase [Acidobacteriota bacterium]